MDTTNVGDAQNTNSENVMERFIDEIIAEHGYTSLDEETKAILKADMMQRLVDQIDQAAINALPEEKAIELADRLDAGEMSQEELSNFMENSGVNLQEVALTTMLQFKMLYSGVEVNEGPEAGVASIETAAGVEMSAEAPVAENNGVAA